MFISKMERERWLEIEFKKIAKEKCWSGDFLLVAREAFFYGAEKIGVGIADKNIGEDYDRRVKMTKAQKNEALREYKGGASMKSLASKYGVSVSLIYYIVNPEAYRKANERAKLFAKNKKGGHRNSSKNTYRYKRMLALEGKI